MRKKQIVVVKSLRESKSPTRTLLISRDAGDFENTDRYKATNLGNTSSKVRNEYMNWHDMADTAGST